MTPAQARARRYVRLVGGYYACVVLGHLTPAPETVSGLLLMLVTSFIICTVAMAASTATFDWVAQVFGVKDE